MTLTVVVAREHVGQAARTARDGLEQVRRMIRDLAPAELTGDPTGSVLADALRRTAERAVPAGSVPVDVRSSAGAWRSSRRRAKAPPTSYSWT